MLLFDTGMRPIVPLKMVSTLITDSGLAPDAAEMIRGEVGELLITHRMRTTHRTKVKEARGR